MQTQILLIHIPWQEYCSYVSFKPFEGEMKKKKAYLWNSDQ